MPFSIATDDTFRIWRSVFIGSIGTYFYHDPVVAFDSALERLAIWHTCPSGFTSRQVGLEVRIAGVVGCVFKDALVVQSDAVYPSFVASVSYDAEHPDTVKLRACIDDEFGGARGEHALSPSEYVHYRLKQNKRAVAWGECASAYPWNMAAKT